MELIDVERVTIQKGRSSAAVQPGADPRKVAAGRRRVAGAGGREAAGQDRDRQAVRRTAGAKPAEARRVDRPVEESRGATLPATARPAADRPSSCSSAWATRISYIFDDHPQKVHKLVAGPPYPGGARPRNCTSGCPTTSSSWPGSTPRKSWPTTGSTWSKAAHFVVLCPDVQVIDADSTEPIL